MSSIRRLNPTMSQDLQVEMTMNTKTSFLLITTSMEINGTSNFGHLLDMVKNSPPLPYIELPTPHPNQDSKKLFTTTSFTIITTIKIPTR